MKEKNICTKDGGISYKIIDGCIHITGMQIVPEMHNSPTAKTNEEATIDMDRVMRLFYYAKRLNLGVKQHDIIAPYSDAKQFKKDEKWKS